MAWQFLDLPSNASALDILFINDAQRPVASLSLCFFFFFFRWKRERNLSGPRPFNSIGKLVAVKRVSIDRHVRRPMHAYTHAHTHTRLRSAERIIYHVFVSRAKPDSILLLEAVSLYRDCQMQMRDVEERERERAAGRGSAIARNLQAEARNSERESAEPSYWLPGCKRGTSGQRVTSLLKYVRGYERSSICPLSTTPAFTFSIPPPRRRTADPSSIAERSLRDARISQLGSI